MRFTAMVDVFNVVTTTLDNVPAFSIHSSAPHIHTTSTFNVRVEYYLNLNQHNITQVRAPWNLVT